MVLYCHLLQLLNHLPHMGVGTCIAQSMVYNMATRRTFTTQCTSQEQTLHPQLWVNLVPPQIGIHDNYHTEPMLN